ncbi:exodeoxyribonuclease VII small subunit [Trinickia caryophylli]|uniref:Exodeoxyribonuclease 7 small subunit n=1 Tax=Trinickia caryophylli TaxID=28094 RepID=A0A1X7EG02_TRICW|nr:exodeoxyribonuclease VII small subunit [Trinickia caryophylli]PMS11086.1 exodeoxyribonuclease VII small subunit [Trinickia caryophylli]TRX14542.1 exodeoxyribonuclease VII small subunit [Trinickia caryophylli]WQE14378.1 exodeoxyribonuclease VII small subunit [Trinickia caryophylli]SMF33233.1 Exodeoxyribonuclease VII small subunit [Trinickia caryophylli]GLU32225.1 exodeoxyribonuclease 7 small subunit [Trinickia caryophylli]
MAKTVSRDPAAPAAGGQNGNGGNGGELPLPDSYETAVAELEQLVARMEGGALSLEESLAAYRRGAALVAYCQQQLEKVEQQVRVLDGETLKPLPAGTSAADCGDDL